MSEIYNNNSSGDGFIEVDFHTPKHAYMVRRGPKLKNKFEIYEDGKLIPFTTAAEYQERLNGIVKVPTAYATYPVALIDFARSKIAEVAAAFDANEVPDEDRSVILPTIQRAAIDFTAPGRHRVPRRERMAGAGVLPDSGQGLVPGAGVAR